MRPQRRRVFFGYNGLAGKFCLQPAANQRLRAKIGHRYRAAVIFSQGLRAHHLGPHLAAQFRRLRDRFQRRLFFPLIAH